MLHRSRFLTVALAIAAVLSPAGGHAVGMWNGQDLLHVPISWCIVQGSPAEAAPNVAGDTTTDALIWRRHERPTDNIYNNPAGITFRSAINDVWGTLSLPIIADPDTNFGQPGDMRGEDVNNFGAEFNQMLNDCDGAWANLGRAGIGITAVNAGLFHDGTDYVGVIGWGGCVVDVMNPGQCVQPWDGNVVIIDNHYLYPTVPDRTFPDGSMRQFALTDPFDQLAGHEFGHALSLPHRNDLTALMNPGQQDNVGMDSQTDNIALNNAEVTAVRNMALVANGLEIDPPNLFVPGSVVGATQADPKRDTRLVAYQDLSALKATYDANTKTFDLGQRLFGLIPKTAAAQKHWFLVDVDGPLRGASPAVLRTLGVPETDFTGADLVIRADVANGKVSGAAWRINNGDPVGITSNVKFRLLGLDMHPHYGTIKGQPSLVERPDYFVYHVVDVSLPGDLVGIATGQTVNAHAIVAKGTGEAVDRLDMKQVGRGNPFPLTPPSFAHCYPQGAVNPGETVKIDFDGLKPNLGYHALLGARMITKGTTDAQGNGTLDMTIPKDTTPGLHLVTIGIDGTALTADCTVIVGGAQK